MIEIKQINDEELSSTNNLNLYVDNILVGKLIYEFVDGYNNYCDGLDLELDDYYKIFGTDEILNLNTIEIFKEYQGNGYANVLMQYFIDNIVTDNISVMLYIAPFNIFDDITKRKLSDIILPRFYSKFGFRKIQTFKTEGLEYLERGKYYIIYKDNKPNLSKTVSDLLTDDDAKLDFINNALDKDYVVHATDIDFEVFDPTFIVGSTRAMHGFGFYFTDTQYKLEEYGSDIFKYKFTNKNKFNLINLVKDTPNKIGLSTLDDLKNILQLTIGKLENQLYDCRSNSEYDYFSKEIEDVELKLNKLKKSTTLRTELFDMYLTKYKDLTFHEIHMELTKKIHTDFLKPLSEYYFNIGYDGFIYENQYVIFNFDKLNNNVKSIRENGEINMEFINEIIN